MDNEYDEPLPEVWAMFLRMIADTDKEYTFLSKIVSNQILKIISNVKQMYEEENHAAPDLSIVHEEYEIEEVNKTLLIKQTNLKV
jgi:hypothetical protein